MLNFPLFLDDFVPFGVLPQASSIAFSLGSNMKQSSKHRQQQLFWGRVVMRKWLNIPTKESDYSADTDSGSDSDISDDEFCDWPTRESRFKDKKGKKVQSHSNDSAPMLRRRNSETFRAQYINTKEIKICAGTWNVGGRVPSDDLDLDDWLGGREPADMYILGRIIWLGDLNYRLNLSYEKTRELIAKKEWSKLVGFDQLSKELRKGRTFDGWSEGTLSFAPTYKYDVNSDKYIGEDPKSGRRTPAWCDRVLSFGKGMRLLRYKRAELRLSDHRPVCALFMVEVEVFSPKKLQKALTFTDAEIDEEPVMTDMGIDTGMSRLNIGEDLYYWER